MHPQLLAAIGISILTNPSIAQAQFERSGPRRLPSGVAQALSSDMMPGAVALGDVDRDGHLDMFVGRQTGDMLLRNNGDGSFVDVTARSLPRVGGWTTAAAFEDVDRDGDLDLFCAVLGQDRLFLNDGSGQFVDATAARLPVDTSNSYAVAFTDINRDGHRDIARVTTLVYRYLDPITMQLVEGRLQRGRIGWLVNDGLGTFSSASALTVNRCLPHPPSSVPGFQILAFHLDDFDRDGDMDMATVVGGSCQPSGTPSYTIEVLLNDGAARVQRILNLGSLQSPEAAFDLGDFNLNSRPDLLVSTPSRLRLFEYVRPNGFVDVTSSGIPYGVRKDTRNARFVDIDRDGFPEIVGPSFVLSNVRNVNNRLFLEWEHIAGVRDAGPLAIGDLDSDGDPDLVHAYGTGNDAGIAFQILAGRRYLGVYLPGAFDLQPEVPALSADAEVVPGTMSLAVLDVDRDGDVDLVTGRRPIYFHNLAPALYLNDGRGSLVEAPGRFRTTVTGVIPLSHGDLDGDGDQDMLLGAYRTVYVAMNNGLGSFVQSSGHVLRGSPTAVAVGDVDGDGDQDVLAGSVGTELLLNDGTGGLTLAPGQLQAVYSEQTYCLALVDVDLDGDLDVIAGTAQSSGIGGGLNRLYRNDGQGRFVSATPRAWALHAHYTRHMAVGDVDGDGDPDVVFGNGTTEQTRMFFNDGNGDYTEVSTRLITDGGRVRGLELTDVDLDGDLDLLAGRSSERSHTLWLNDGTGRLLTDASTSLPASLDETTDLGVADVDGDGDPDFVTIAYENHPLRLYTNLQRHLHAPDRAYVGAQLTIDLFAAPGHVMAVALAPHWARIPLATWGVLGLDPQTSIAIGVFVSPAGRRVRTHTPIPSDPGLAGLRLYLQMLDVDPNLGATGTHLSNVVFEVVRN